jgi:hypothetical protein
MVVVVEAAWIEAAVGNTTLMLEAGMPAAAATLRATRAAREPFCTAAAILAVSDAMDAGERLREASVAACTRSM